MDTFVKVFTDFIIAATPYAIVWRIGEYIATVLIDVICGRKGRGGGYLDL